MEKGNTERPILGPKGEGWVKHLEFLFIFCYYFTFAKGYHATLNTRVSPCSLLLKLHQGITTTDPTTTALNGWLKRVPHSRQSLPSSRFCSKPYSCLRESALDVTSAFCMATPPIPLDSSLTKHFCAETRSNLDCCSLPNLALCASLPTLIFLLLSGIVIDICRPGWLQTHRDLPATATQVLGLKVCTITAQFK